MRSLYFSANEVARLARKAARAKDDICWAKDEGTYLLASNGGNRMPDVVYGVADDGTPLNPPRYQDDPETWERIYDIVADACGGDDFGEYFDPTPFLTIRPDQFVVISTDDDNFEIRLIDKVPAVVLEGIAAEKAARESAPDYEQRTR